MVTTLSRKSQLCSNFVVNSREETNTRKMDGIILILFSWFFVAILCYFLILAYNRRRNSIHGATSAYIWSMEESNGKKFLNDIANWLLWGLNENAFNDQGMAPAFGNFVKKALSDSLLRLHKEGKLEVHIDSIELRDKSTISALHNFHIHPNRTSGSYLSITGQLSNTRNKHGPICLRISVLDSEEEKQFQQQAQQENGVDYRKQMPTLKAPSIRQFTILIHELVGEVEIRLASIAGELFVIGCFKNRPVIQMELVESVDDSQKTFLEDFIKRTIFGAVINFSIGELLYPDAETSARASRARLSAEYRNLTFLEEIYSQNGAAYYVESHSRMSPKFPLEGNERISPNELLSANCLRIQLIEADQLEGFNSKMERPFVCIELDEPNGERFLSSRAHLDHQKRQRVFWLEGEANFEMSVNPNSGELLFEVFTEQEDDNSFNTVRERRFLGMSIMSLGELRKIVSRQNGIVQLQLQGKPEFNKDRRPHHAEINGILVMKCSFYYQPINRPSAPFNNQGPFMAAEYAQIKRKKTPPNEEAVNKKFSTSTIGSKQLTRQKQHYIYNVTEDKFHHDFNYESEASVEKRSPSKISFDTSNLSPSRPEFEDPMYSTIEGLNVNPIRKTISDTNALFLFNGERGERKKSAPETPVSTNKKNQNGTNMAKSSEKIIEEHKMNLEEEIRIHRPNEPFEHLFNGNEEKEHPAMEIFKMPEGTKEVALSEIERRARERDRSARGRKQRRNFFEQIRARLSGPVRFLPGMHGKRAKSLDDYEHPHLEEVVSMPQSRDQSQTRYGEKKGSDHHIESQYLFVKSAGPSSASSMQFLHSPQSTSQRTFSFYQNQLILELTGPDEEGSRYYSIPIELSTEPAVVKLLQSGKKLHIYNGHILVASKSRGRVVCSICSKRIGGNFSNRQAYQCRDCRIVCHKNCHRRIDWACENSTVNNLNILDVDWEEFLRHHQLREFISIGNL